MLKSEEIVYKGQKQMRRGYTTGSCAAAAVKAAVSMLLGKEEIVCVTLMTPKGIELYLEVEEVQRNAAFVSCAIRKDSGDDPDVTNGVLVYAKVAKKEGEQICLDGGKGIGRITRKGFSQDIGEAAINKVPKEMILKEAREICEKYHYKEGLEIEISIPKGEELAERTFNPRLGILGGISVLGTSGIVEPMSEKALIHTIHLELKVLRELGKEYCYIVPGNYGSDFLKESLGFDEVQSVKCSNFIGEAIDHALLREFKGILLIGHVGKFIKLAAGIMNTHSNTADGRMEVFAAHAALVGAKAEVIWQIMNCGITDEAIGILKAEGIFERVMESVMQKIEYHLENRVHKKMEIGAILFSNEYGIIGKTKLADEIVREMRGNK